MKSSENVPSHQALDSLQKKFPELAETLNYIVKLQQATRGYPFLEFVEHVAAIGFEDKKPDLALLTPDLLATWITHMSHGTRLRMEVLEDAILSGLADGRLLIPSVLARCHLEVAGFAAQTYHALCRFGIRGFVEVIGPHRNGRKLQYTRNEKLEYPDALNLATALLWSMRGGHACAALMYCGEIIEDEKGLRYSKADRESGQFVWEHILQREPS